MQKTVVQFGAGNIGRGFTGQLFTEAGYEVVFVDVQPEVVAALNERRSYPLRLAGPDRRDELLIEPVRAVDGRDLDAVARELAACDFGCTAVGVPALPHVGPALARGMEVRQKALDVILCENQLHCSEMLRGFMRPYTPPGLLAQLGLVESVVGRMVPVVSDEQRREDPLLAIAEDYPTLPVDRDGFVGPIPDVPAVKPVKKFDAWVERKLYLHNLGHAVTAYLGYLEGCEYVHEATRVAHVESISKGAMLDAAQMLAKKHGFHPAELKGEWMNLWRRFSNPALCDTVLRVGRDPIRKLRPSDRLIGGAMNCLDQGVEPERIVWGIVAAMRFDPPSDPAAQELQRVIREEGLGTAIRRFTGQGPESELGRRIIDAWDRFDTERKFA